MRNETQCRLMFFLLYDDTMVFFIYSEWKSLRITIRFCSQDLTRKQEKNKRQNWENAFE